MPFQDWDSVEFELDQTVKSSSACFDPATIANVKDLLAACRVYCPVPEKDGGLNIWYEEHTPGQLFSSRFLDQLPRLTRKGPALLE